MSEKGAVAGVARRRLRTRGQEVTDLGSDIVPFSLPPKSSACLSDILEVLFPELQQWTTSDAFVLSLY